MPTLGFTHFQPAQPTTVGKRACLWLQDLLSTSRSSSGGSSELRLRGLKGTTGTQASFLALFDGDHEKVRRARAHASARRLGFDRTLPGHRPDLPAQGGLRACSRRWPASAQSCAKFAQDLRLLAHLREVEEPFGAQQVGSSAMPYKRNPMRAERMSGSRASSW